MLLLVRRLFRNLRQSRFRMNSPRISPVQPTVQQMVAEEKENMDTLPAGKVEENAPNMELPVPSREVTLDSSPKQDDASEQPAASVFQSDEPEELPVAPLSNRKHPISLWRLLIRRALR